MRRRLAADCLSEAGAVDGAVYGAIAASETPTLDVAMRGLSRTADHGKLWFATAAAISLFGGSRAGAQLATASSPWAWRQAPPTSPSS